MMEAKYNTINGLFISGRKILQSRVDYANKENKTETYNNFTMDFIDEEAFNKLLQHWLTIEKIFSSGNGHICDHDNCPHKKSFDNINSKIIWRLFKMDLIKCINRRNTYNRDVLIEQLKNSHKIKN